MRPPPLELQDWIGPALGAVAFVLGMSLVREPSRRTFNAVFAAGAIGVYLSGGGLGPWELVFPLLATPVVHAGLRSYRFIGLFWLMHAGWDLVHHLLGNPIWPFMPTSAFGCLLFDTLIGAWFLCDAPALLWRRRAPPPEPRAPTTEG